MAEQDGRIVLTEYDDAYHEGQLTQLRRLRECVDKYCHVVPVYGVEEPPPNLLKFREVIDEESYDALLLALEKDALFLTLDGRLRELAGIFGGIKGVWPQAYVAAGSVAGLCSNDEYSRFVFTSLVKRRTHVSINAMDFIWMLSQPMDFQNFAMRALLKYLADPSVELTSAVNFIAESLKSLTASGATLAASRRIIEILLPMMFVREDADADGIQRAIDLTAVFIVNMGFNSSRVHPLAAPKVVRRRNFWQSLLLESIAKARRLAKEQTVDELSARPLNVGPVYGTTESMYRVNGATEAG